MRSKDLIQIQVEREKVMGKGSHRLFNFEGQPSRVED